MIDIADLHMHSSCSDGQYDPTELMKKAHEKGVNIISLTDHDTMLGTKAARDAAVQLGMRFISGVEISSGEGGDVHVLGYGLNEDDSQLNDFLTAQRTSRETRIAEMLEKLEKLGFPLDKERIFARAAGSIGRPHIADEMVEMNYVTGPNEAFDKYLNEGAPAYVPRKKVDTETAISLICELGGIPVLAHPGLIKEDFKAVERSIHKWCEFGLKGLEVYYPAHQKTGFELWRSLAADCGLIMTGGSDFHKEADEDDDHGMIASMAGYWRDQSVDTGKLLKLTDRVLP
ncbi:MAG: hypothetical protein CW338_10500 [Clostridiales bacterium]|nr:hypothetical protein [Clostridiales bacterium]